MDQSISMMRASAPKLPVFGQALQKTWREIAESGESLAAEFQTHRFDGTEADRAAAIRWIGSRITPKSAIDRVMITNGTMNSILLLSSSLVGPGNVILTEELTFPIAYTLTKIAGARVEPVQIDAFGMVPEDFEKKCATLRPKAVYVNCTVHSPTAYVMPVERRKAIAEIARRYGVQILEDEAQSLYLDDAPSSFASLAPDITWYLMGLSKYLSLGIRMGFVVAPSKSALSAVLQQLRPVTSWHVAPIIATIVSRWIENGQAQALLEAARSEVHARQRVASEILSDVAGYRGSMGIHFWLGAPEGISSIEFAEAIAAAGVIVRPSRLYSGEREPRQQGIRPGVGEPANIDEMRRAVEILRDTYRSLSIRHSGQSIRSA